MKRLLPLVALLAAVPAWAQDGAKPALRFCPNRPSLGSSACTTDPGHVQLELGGVDWQRDDQAGSREDQVIAGDVVARIGVASHTEIQVGWTALGHVRSRDKATGAIASAHGVGDVTIGVRQNLRSPDGSGLSFGIQPFVTLPTGRESIGAGDYALGVVIPVTYDLSDRLNLAFTGEVDDAADEIRDGHHLEYSGIVGLGFKATKSVTLVGELALAREDDPSGYRTIARAAGSVAWAVRDGVQLDVLAVAGLNRDAPDVQLAFGGAVRF